MPQRPDRIRFYLDAPQELVKGLLSPIKHRPIVPEIVTKDKVRVPQAYRRFQRLSERESFCNDLDAALLRRWSRTFSSTEAKNALKMFQFLSGTLRETGALIIGNLVRREYFGEFVRTYDSLIRDYGSVAPIHTYVDLRDHPAFIGGTVNGALMHPLAVALIARRIGEPVRVVDARCKDTLAMRTRAKDNMLHIDDTPFNDEFKILLSWDRGTASGPKGQNLVFLPGTNRGTRNCHGSDDHGAWLTENGSVFNTYESVDRLFDFQKRMLGNSTVRVVRVADDSRPLTTIFEAGSLVHHRYRTSDGPARSSVTVAFHSSLANPGQFVPPRHLSTMSDLDRRLLGYQDESTSPGFLLALLESSTEIGSMLIELIDSNAEAVVIDQESLELSPEDLRRWHNTVLEAPEVEEVRLKSLSTVVGREFTVPQLLAALSQSIMMHDKHGALDLMLYSDNREQIRKLARNRIRELSAAEMEARLENWASAIQQPSLEHLLVFDDLRGCATGLIRIIERVLDESSTEEQVASLRSLRQLVNDLGEAIGRCDSIQTFCSTGLFLFWCCDEALRLKPPLTDDLFNIAGKLLRHYLAVAILAYNANIAYLNPSPPQLDSLAALS